MPGGKLNQGVFTLTILQLDRKIDKKQKER
jgi:hypothetical protein